MFHSACGWPHTTSTITSRLCGVPWLEGAIGMGKASGRAFASDQKLVHGAGTLPHMTSAITLSGGFELQTPIFYALRYDIRFGNRVQLGLSASVLENIFVAEMHSMFNVLKTVRCSDFFSLYLNPTYVYFKDFFLADWKLILLAPGVAYEHRCGKSRRVGF